MDIAWDVYDRIDSFSGIATHARELRSALRPQGIDPVILTSNEFLKFGRKLYEPLLSFQNAKQRFKNSRRWIYHGLSNLNVPFLGSIPNSCRLILTVHDIIPLLEKGLVSKSLEIQFRLIFPKAIARADAVICVSDWTKDRILEHFPGVNGRKFTVIENGVDHFLKASTTSTGKIYQSKRPKILFVSRYEAYKGFDVLSRIIGEKHQDWDFDIVTNEAGRSYLMRKIGGILSKSNGVLIQSQVSSENLRKIYESSSVVLHPSRFEGFGFPVYEALSYGKPVVCLRSQIWGKLITCPLVFQSEDNGLDGWLLQLNQALLVQTNTTNCNKSFLEEFNLPTWQDAAIKTKSLYNSL